MFLGLNHGGCTVGKIKILLLMANNFVYPCDHYILKMPIQLIFHGSIGQRKYIVTKFMEHDVDDEPEGYLVNATSITYK